jgi:hypothetical protein
MVKKQKIPALLFVKNNVIIINRHHYYDNGFYQRHYEVNERNLRLFKMFGFHLDIARELIAVNIDNDINIFSMYPLY